MSAAVDLTTPERREKTRVVYDGAVECEVGGVRVLDYLVNLSEGGAAISASRLQAPVGAPIKLRFRVPGTPEKSELSGWVVRMDIDEEGATVAVRFAELPPRVAEALARLAE